MQCELQQGIAEDNKVPEEDKVLPDGCNYTGGFTNDKNCTYHTDVSIAMMTMTMLTILLMLMLMTPRQCVTIPKI